MTTESRIQALLTADPGKLQKIDGILNGTGEEHNTPGDRRLLSMTQAAEALQLSRQTVWRMIKESRLPVIETRRGRYRIPSAAITELITRGRHEK